MNFQENPPKKVLIINIFGIGDVLFTTPLISNLKESYPDMEIGYLCNRRTVCVLEGNPRVNKIFVYERDELMAVCEKSRWLYFKELRKLFKSIKDERYDAVIDVSLNRFTSFLSWFVGIPSRIGFNYKNRSVLLNKKINLIAYENQHVVEYYFRLLEELNVPIKMKELELFVNQGDRDWSDQFLQDVGINMNRSLIGIFPGGGESWGKDAIYKRWGAEKYAKLADKIIENFSAEIILFGGKDEQDLCNEVSGLMHNHAHTACGKTTISQFAALAHRCKLVILNDGGPLHVAVAAGAQTISIFGPVDDLVYGPYPLGNHKVIKKDLPCRPCYRRFKRSDCEHISCLRDITVDEVLETTKEVL